MTRNRKLVRLLVIIIATVGLGLGVRELFYFKSISRYPALVRVELPTMVTGSDLIVRGIVEKSMGTSRYYDDSGELVVGTRWKVKVAEALKGDHPETLVIRTLGGRYGLTEMIVEDEAEFTPGEAALLFLEPDPNSDDYRVVGSSQGHFTINGGQAVQQESGETKMLAELESLIRAQ